METARSPAPAAIRIVRTLPAPREDVFRAWTNPQALVKWFAPTQQYVTRVPALDLREGGLYRVEMSLDGKAYTVAGKYLEIRPPEKLVFTWRWENEPDASDAGDSIVTLELFDRGNATEFRLTHERIASEAAREEHEKGWKGCLDRLQDFIT
jgi:uncharacterized protein YndB with AHSA1/START domain